MSASDDGTIVLGSNDLIQRHGDGPRKGASRQRVAVDSLAAAVLLIAIPTGILLYYFIFFQTYYIVSLIVFVVGAAVVARPRDLAYPQLLPVVGLYLWMGVTVLWTPATDAALQYGVAGVFASFAIVAGTLKSRFEEDFALRLMMLCAGAFALCTVVTFVQTDAFIDASKGSIRTLLGAFFLAGLPAATYFAVRQRSAVASVILVTIMVVGFQLGSRTFILVSLPAVLLTLMVIGRHSRFFKLARWPIFVLAALSILAVVLEASNFSVVSLLENIAGRGGSFIIDEATFTEARSPASAAADLERRLLVAVGIESFNRAPLFGAGFLSTTYYVGFYYAQDLSAHGLPLFLLGEIGLVGTALFLVTLWIAVAGFFKHARLLDGNRATVAYVELITLVIIIFNGLFHQVYDDFYFYLFLGIGAWRRRQASLMEQARGSSAHGLSI